MDSAPPPSPMWLSHHHPDGYDRCVRMGRLHVCRRCLVVYPLAVAVAVLVATGVRSPDVELLLMWVLPAGVTVEWVGEHLFGWDHRPTRLVVASAVAAVGAGVALGRHVLEPFEMAALAPMLVYAAICGFSALLGAARRTAARMGDDWENDHESAEAERWERLSALVDSDAAH